jgi:hypothetical protein
MRINVERYLPLIALIVLIATVCGTIIAHNLPMRTNPYAVYLHYSRAQLEDKARCQHNNSQMPEFATYCVVESNGGSITFSYDTDERLRTVCFWGTPSERLGDLVALYGIYSDGGEVDAEYQYTFDLDELQIVAVTDEDSLDAMVSYAIFSMRSSHEPIDVSALPVCQ